MAKLNVSLLGRRILGTIGNAVTFDYQHGIQILKRKPIPTDRRTNLQLAQRQKVRSCGTEWQALDPDEKQAWIDKAKGYPQTAFGLFLTMCLMAPPTPPTKICDGDQDTCWDVEQAPDEDKIHGKTAGVESFLIDADGILDLVKQSAIRAHFTGTESIPNATITKVQLNTEDFDIQGEFDPTTNYRFTAKKAGTYLIVAQVRYAFSSASDNQFQARLHKNGAEWQIYYIYGIPAHWTPVMILALDHLVANDYIELFAYQDSGSDVNLTTGSGQNFLAIAKIA